MNANALATTAVLTVPDVTSGSSAYTGCLPALEQSGVELVSLELTQATLDMITDFATSNNIDYRAAVRHLVHAELLGTNL